MIITSPKQIYILDKFDWQSLDYQSSDPAYWAATRKSVFAAYAKSSQAKTMWNHIKTVRQNAKQKLWSDVLSEEVVAWAHAWYGTMDYDMMDNLRVARADISSQVRRYKKQRLSGCCGSYDTKIRGPGGHMYLIGFNYGH